ncbi:MAG: GNAT family N-acetyltransferase [Alphaproteobacteria bacterium]|nr:GNAT family N-acetyltransferase [Alphaproteobacteria bacterium]
MKITLRPATPADAQRWQEICIAGINNLYPEFFDGDYMDLQSDTFASRVRGMAHKISTLDNSCFIVAEDGTGNIVGIVGGRMHKAKDGTNSFSLRHLYVDLKYLRKGIGTKLIMGFADWVIKNGGKKFTAWYFADDRVRGFFDSLGGVLVKELAIDELKTLVYELDVCALQKKYCPNIIKRIISKCKNIIRK